MWFKMCEIARGWRAKIKKDGIELDSCEHVTLDLNTNLELYWEAGEGIPKLLKEKELEITGTIGRFHKDSTLLDLVIPLTKFDLILQRSTTPGDPVIYLYDCYLLSSRIDYEVKDFSKEEFNFIATSISLDIVGRVEPIPSDFEFNSNLALRYAGFEPLYNGLFSSLGDYGGDNFLILEGLNYTGNLGVRA